MDTLPETRSRLGAQVEHRLRRWRSAALPIAQAALAAGASWLIAVHIFGHRVPFFAPVAAVVCLSLSLGERLRRVIELILGIAIGVGVGDLLLSRVGTGPWQIALVVALAMSVAVLLDCGAVSTVQAAVSAVLISTLYVPGDAAGINRVVDGLIGGTTGLLAAGVFRRSAWAGRRRRDPSRPSSGPRSASEALRVVHAASEGEEP